MRNRFIFKTCGFVICGLLVLTTHAADAPVARIHAGPVYTRGGEAGSFPQFPDLQIQVEVPPTSNPALVEPSAFSLKVDGGSPTAAVREQALASTGYGMAVSVAIDVSGSMKGAPLNAVRTGLGKFVGDAGPADKIAIQTIADDSRWEASWEDPRDHVRSALDKLAARGSLTRLWDGLLDALQRFPQNPLAQRIIVISDGHDEGSRHTEQDVIAAALQHGVVVDAVGITRSNPVYLQELERLTIQTGGQFRAAKDSNDLQQLVSSGVERLKSTPIVSFRPNGVPADGKMHRFEVTWKAGGAEAHAKVSAVIPQAFVRKETLWYWGIGAVAGVLVLGILLGALRKRPSEDALVAVVPPPKPAALPPRPVEAGKREKLSAPMPAPKPGSSETGSSEAASAEPLLPPRVKTKIMARFPTPAKGRPAAWLYCEEGFAPGERFPLEQSEYWIGSLEGNDLQITSDATVSANHACLVFDHDVLGIYDHRSTNGTRINGEVIGEGRCLLKPGDRIRIGRSTFALQIAGPEEQAT